MSTCAYTYQLPRLLSHPPLLLTLSQMAYHFHILEKSINKHLFTVHLMFKAQSFIIQINGSMQKVNDVCHNCILYILRIFKIRLNAFQFGNKVGQNMQTALVTTLEAADKHLSLIPCTKVHNRRKYLWNGMWI